ncbi:hypothetical protein AAFA46_05460 [Oscillospiraceae bacterium WX1]
MDGRFNELINNLNNAVLNDDFIDVSEDVTEELEERSDAFEAVEPILRLMENNPNVDFGKPGALVHYVEKFYRNGYEEKLVESLERKPIKHTVWMLNRIINGSQGDRRDYFIKVLDKVLSFPNLDTDVVSFAYYLKSLHVQ